MDWYRIGGLGPFSDLLIKLLSNPESFLKNKSVLIFCVGTGHIFECNRKETMLDIAKLDSERILLNGKRIKERFFLESKVEASLISSTELWGPLSSIEKTVHLIDNTGELTYNLAIKKTDDSIIDSDPIVCVIPHTCVCNTTCDMTINGIKKTMHSPNYPHNQRFFNLTCELPAGTKDITIRIEGKPDTLIAIKDIQIWQ